jgi:hypothetical protein
MIARPLPAPAAAPDRARGWRTARNASVARRARRRRLRYRLIGRTLVAVTIATFAGLAYLAMLANVTRLHYEIVKQKQIRKSLAVYTARNEDEIAGLAARDRLSAIAASLNMREAVNVTVVDIPPPPRHVVAQPDRGVVFLSSVAGWLK